MKKIVALAILVALMTGCASKTEFGDCIGAFEDKKPDLDYKLSVRNTVLAVIFSETVVVPVMVVANQTHCPVGKKK
jgi:hypothetical protein